MAAKKDMRLCREIKNPPLLRINELLKDQPQVMEEGITLLDNEVVIPAIGEIDHIAATQGRLTLISIFAALNPNHLSKAVGINRWVQENMNVLKHEYSKKGIVKDYNPRILFLCSDINSAAMSLLPLLNNLPLEVLRYRCLQSGDDRWLAIEKIYPDQKEVLAKEAIDLIEYEVGLPRRHCDDDPPRNSLKKYQPIELTADEIGEFFDAPPDEELDFSGPYFTQI